MQRILLLFGSSGQLGKGLISTFQKQVFEKIYLFGSKEGESYPKTEFIKVKDLSIEENVIKAFDKIVIPPKAYVFLFSTIGGFTGGTKIWNTSFDDWEEMFSKNVETSFLLAKHFALKVKECKGGSILFSSAYSGVEVEAKKAAYGSAKAALNFLIKCLAEEGQEIRLTANGIAPYFINTEENRKWNPDEDTSTWIKPEEIGNLALDIFKNFTFINGNIFLLKDKIKLTDK